MAWGRDCRRCCPRRRTGSPIFPTPTTCNGALGHLSKSYTPQFPLVLFPTNPFRWNRFEPLRRKIWRESVLAPDVFVLNTGKMDGSNRTNGMRRKSEETDGPALGPDQSSPVVRAGSPRQSQIAMRRPKAGLDPQSAARTHHGRRRWGSACCCCCYGSPTVLIIHTRNPQKCNILVLYSSNKNDGSCCCCTYRYATTPTRTATPATIEFDCNKYYYYYRY